MKSDFIVKTKMIAAIRKIWRNSPLRKCALEMHCATPFEIQKKRLYKCDACKKVFLAQQIEVDHIKATSHDSYDVFTDRMLCGISKIKKNQEGDMADWLVITKDGFIEKLSDIVCLNLRVLCLDCHKKKTQNERKKK